MLAHGRREKVSVVGFIGESFFPYKQQRLAGNSLQSHFSVALLVTLCIVIGFSVLGNLGYLDYRSDGVLAADALKWRNFTAWMQVVSSGQQDGGSGTTADSKKGEAGGENFYFTLGAHDSQEYKNFVLVETYLYRPELFGLEGLGLGPETFVRFSPDEKVLAEGLAASESNFRQFEDEEQSIVYVSEIGCKGIFQGCNSICPEIFWENTKTNIWCGMKYFRQMLDTFPGDWERAIAAYKGAFLMVDTDFDGEKDTVVNGDDGKPIIDPKLIWQVDKVWDYVHPYPD